jgi:dephospho-CoA kinase
MLKVGITGGIGSGKSMVARVFEVLGVPVLYADATAKKLMTHDVSLREKIIDTFGASAYVGGELNRSWLAMQVFSSPEKTALLNGLVHPSVVAYTRQWFAEQEGPYAVKEAALFFESGTAGEVDSMIGVYAPKPLRLQRVMKRDGIDAHAVAQRMSRQIDEEIKMRLCDRVIRNDELTLVIPQVLLLHQQFVASSLAG